MTGDCPNCLISMDGEPGFRACTTEACEGQKVKRGSGRPSADFDLLAVTDRAHKLMPVGFYYKTFIRPRWAWGFAEKIIRRATGIGRLPVGRAPKKKDSRHVHPDLLVIGGGVAGLSAAIAAAERGESIVLCDEGRSGEKVASGPTLERIRALTENLRDASNASILERHTAVGIYEGPLVPLIGEDELVQVHPGRIVVATGAVETHPVFRGNDLPGVWLGRGAARMAGVHGVEPGSLAVVATDAAEGLEHMRTLMGSGVDVAAVLVPEALADGVRDVPVVVRGGRIVAAEGRKHLQAVVVDTGRSEQRIECDTLVVSLGFSPRDALLRMGTDLPVSGAGDVVAAGCTLEEAVESGTRAGNGETAEPVEPPPVAMGKAGYVCLCEDVGVKDLEQAWREGWRSSEILKRYTTATMGPCQGAMCGRHLAAFVSSHGTPPQAGARTTARPPARTFRLEDLAAGVHEVIEKRTALHERHLALGAKLDWSGSWMRPYRYGDLTEEYRAVRERVSLMDVGTLGKFLVAGRDAMALVDRVFPCKVENLTPGRSRYMLALDEAGYVKDDGLICALEGGRFYITSTSGGADRMEAWLRNWADRWDLHIHLVNQTPMLGAINVAGPHARELLSRLTDDPIDRDAMPYPGHREITVAGVACRAIRVGFVGELSFELHHARSRSAELWDSLMRAGADLGIRPHGLDALDVLRLEKGHFYLGQDTLPDDHPVKLGLGWAVAMDKPSFIGRTALERMAELPKERQLVGLEFGAKPQRGAPLYAGDRVVGRVTSCAHSRALGHAVGLGWLRAIDGEFLSELRAGTVSANVVPTPFYDREGARLRA
jgi:sarcosine oxidase subunit alpha